MTCVSVTFAQRVQQCSIPQYALTHPARCCACADNRGEVSSCCVSTADFADGEDKPGTLLRPVFGDRPTLCRDKYTWDRWGPYDCGTDIVARMPGAGCFNACYIPPAWTLRSWPLVGTVREGMTATPESKQDTNLACMQSQCTQNIPPCQHELRLPRGSLE
jgi:hypothetical protein